jgi:hypothetical protein
MGLKCGEVRFWKLDFFWRRREFYRRWENGKTVKNGENSEKWGKQWKIWKQQDFRLRDF